MTRRFVFSVALVALAGCAHSTTVITPPPPPLTQSAVFAWGKVNAFSACGATAAIAPCNVNLAILDKTTGLIVTNPAIGTTTYTLSPAPSGAVHQYALFTNIRNPDGTVSQSEQVIAVQIQ